MSDDWLDIRRGAAPLIVSIPHTGTDLLDLEPKLVSRWLALKDADWHIEQLYAFAAELDVTIIRTRVSRTIIDVNRDPSGASLYPGQATTSLCPATSFDGEPLYRDGCEPDANEIARRRAAYFEPYQRALQTEIMRLKQNCGIVALYDCHSIRSVIPRLFDGELPKFNLGTNSGASASPELIARVVEILERSGESFVVDGRFKGGFITRSFGAPAMNVHALQMELACRAYLDEPVGPVDESNWPTPFDANYAAATRGVLKQILEAVFDWTRRETGRA